MIKVLIIRLSSIGDIIHTYPMIKDIKDNVKNCSIDWVIDENFADLLKYNENINNIITIPLREWKKNKVRFIFNFVTWYKSLKYKNYDYIIDSQGLIKSSILTKCFNGKSYGYDYYSIREKIASFLYDNTIKVNKALLATVKNRLLAANIFGYIIDNNIVNFGIYDTFTKYFTKIFDYKYVIFFHATSKIEKKYPAHYWVNIASHILSTTSLKILIPYGNSQEHLDAELIKLMVDSDNVIVPTRIFNFCELYSLIYASELVIGVDTGLIHLANALNKKIISLFTNTDPKKTGIVESKFSKNLGGIKNIPGYNIVNIMFDNFMKVNE